MKEPTPRNSRLALAGGLIAILAVGSGGFVLGRRDAERPGGPPSPAVAPRSAPAAPPAAASVETLDRAGLLAIAAAAADAAAQGRPGGGNATRLDGRRFSIALPFGCGGPLAEGDAASSGWHYDPATKALRVQVAMAEWTPADWWGPDAPPDLRAVEGFWVRRPWSTGETCPPAAVSDTATGIDAVTLPGQTVALARLVVARDPRPGPGRNAAYSAIVRKDPDAVQAGRGFRLRLTGRLASVPGGGVSRCRQPGGIDQPPICLVTVSFGEIAIENGATGETLARWSEGDRSRDE